MLKVASFRGIRSAVFGVAPRRDAPLLAAVLAVGMIALTGCGAGDHATAGSSPRLQTVSVGHTKDLSNAPLYIAMAKGYFAQNGIEVQDQIIASGATGMSLVATGRLNVLQAGLSAGYFNSIHQKLDLKIVGGGNVMPEPGSGPAPGGLLVRKSLVDSGQVKSISDLKGHPMALTGGLGAALSYFADRVLRTGGLSVSDVKAVNVGVADTATALKTGAVDAAVGVEPYASQAISQGVAVNFAPLPAGSGVAAMMYNSAFSSSPSAKGFYAAMARAACDLRPEVAKSDENLAILSAALGVPSAQIKATAFYAFDMAPSTSNVADARFVAKDGPTRVQRPSADGSVDRHQHLPKSPGIFCLPRFAERVTYLQTKMNPIDQTLIQPHIAVKEVSKSFIGPAGITHALENVSLSVSAGSFVCLLGPSGCGKSTLLRIIGGLEQADEGLCEIDRATHPTRPAMVFQGGGLFPWRTVLRNVTFPLEIDGISKKERNETAHYWIEQVGLRGFADSYPHQMSGGMRQRVAIARAFASGSDLLLMDEPLGALDAQTRALMQEQLLDLWQQHRKTVVFVTHSLDEGLLLGDRIIMMSSRPGRVRDDLEVPFDRPRDARLVGSSAFAELKATLWDSLRDEVAAGLLIESSNS
ncbi:ATP-binding cassette domain-containing protein [Arthrobacter sp. Hiyo1]|uniref:ATP-binding cassette domain-containing protein n=1 Tax=Arthrobacter sp. Hiyo1 TaxID=1588020 RepID=UPI001558ABF7|nr:ATP-binding cassette domain-containing protein [Arthrobacter sp. Hiyo1]